MPNKNRKNKVMYYGHVSEHDDRVPIIGESTRRVSFKNYGNNRNNNFRQRGRDEKMRVALALQEDDVDMMIGSSFNSNNRRRIGFRDVRRRGGQRGGRGGLRGDSPNPGRMLSETPFNWYKVLIPEGFKYEKSYLIGLIQSYIKPLTFTPYGFDAQGDCVYFYVDDFKVAQQILQADRKITTYDNWRLIIAVRANIPPVEVTDALRVLMKLAMSTRYDAVNKALDLSKFHADPAFVKENIFCPLNRPNVLIAALGIVGESVPDVLVVTLKDNKLCAIDPLKKLKTSAALLKVLDMSENSIRYIDQFDSLQGLQIEELNLDGNPLCNRFKDKESYIREVQKRFPRVVKLDGTDVPRMITFDVEEDIPLVASQGSFMCDPAATEVIKPFLMQYYTFYDGESRAPLADAYHEDAQFSLACSHQNVASSSLAPYLQDSRNFLVVNSSEKRKRLLRRGKANIVSYLMTLPKTQHDPASITVDCSIFSPLIIMVSVSGVFREVGDKKYPLRSFHRSFVIVPVNSGFCILNEMLHITPATSDQVKASFKTPEAQAAAPVPAAVVSPVAVPGPSTAPQLDIATKHQMVTTFAAQSGMNMVFSEKCLSENNWDYNSSVLVFTEFQKQGKIPPEAFIK